ncbi:PEX14 [Candida margitis]|uniref:PEX14 n=1 Tax=Candida margitis TaxID=1775924 RepID=UPI002226D54D|nr:PEX14 [Candida margitis]KAI5968297.1 PEX14 [Candida margitis]
MNDELINSAVSFLRDPNVASAALTKKVEFLESKGLNQEEIEEALKRVNEPESSSSTSVTPSSSNTTTTSHQQSQPQQQQLPIDYYNVAPPVPERSWKDYFIMATATAGVTYGLYQVVTKYLVPSIIPPSQSSIEQDKEVINEEFIKIDKILEQLTKEQEEIKTANEEKLKDIDTVIENINDFLARYNKDKFTFDDNLKLMRLEIDNLSNSIEKNMKLNKEDVNYELIGLKDELQSLKNLIQVRGANSSGGSAGAGVSNGASNNAGRNIAPVSSIPSASEILKRAKAKNEAPTAAPSPSSASSAPSAATTTQQASSTPSQAPATTSKDETPKPEGSGDRLGGWSLGKVTSAGIPAWQMKHREQELHDELGQGNELSSSIPAWQKDGAKSETKTEAEIDEKIKSAGIPPWQLPSAENKSAAGEKSDEKTSGIPSWQNAASTTGV